MSKLLTSGFSVASTCRLLLSSMHRRRRALSPRETRQGFGGKEGRSEGNCWGCFQVIITKTTQMYSSVETEPCSREIEGLSRVCVRAFLPDAPNHLFS